MHWQVRPRLMERHLRLQEIAVSSLSDAALLDHVHSCMPVEGFGFSGNCKLSRSPRFTFLFDT